MSLYSQAKRLTRRVCRSWGRLRLLLGVRKRLECDARGGKELVLELDPVQAQRMQEALEHVHRHQNGQRRRQPRGKANNDGDWRAHVPRGDEDLFEKDVGELCDGGEVCAYDECGM